MVCVWLDVFTCGFMEGVTPNIITYGTVIKAYCSANRLEQAFAVLEEPWSPHASVMKRYEKI